MYRQQHSMLAQVVEVILAVSASLPQEEVRGTERKKDIEQPPPSLPAVFLLVELGDTLVLLRVVGRKPIDALLLGCV